MKLRPIMNDHVARKIACRWEMGNNEFSWSGLMASDVKRKANEDRLKRKRERNRNRRVQPVYIALIKTNNSYIAIS